MAIAAMLDRFDSDWKVRIFENGVSLTSLASEALEAEPDELKASLAKIKSGPEYDTLVGTKRQLEADGRKDTLAMLEAINRGPKTTLEIDYRGLKNIDVTFAYTPFGVRAVDDNRTIYTLVPIQARFGSDDFSFAQSTPTATLEDRLNRRFRFQLNETIDVEELTSLLPSTKEIDGTIDGLDVDLGGVKLKAKKAIVEYQVDAIHIRFIDNTVP